ncbi:hypothetical protein Tsubulata_048995, partial [Turnera subulata]
IYSASFSSPSSSNNYSIFQQTTDRKVAAILRHMDIKRKSKYISKTGSITSTPESHMSTTDSDICRINKRLIGCDPGEHGLPVSFTMMEVEETNRIGDLVG